MAFAQSRGGEGSSSATSATGQAGDDLFGKVDSDGDGAVSKTELQALLEAMSGGTANQTGVSGDDVFSQLDTDGDGNLTQAEFDSGRPSGPGAGTDGMQAMGGMPPPPGGPRGAGSAGAASDSSSTTSYDPLDTNEDGVVSAAERLAGGNSTAEQDAITALFNAIDTDGDARISASESKAFIDQLTSQVQSTASSNTSTESTGRNDLARLADFTRQQYERAASDWRTASNTSSLSAVA